MDNFDRTLGDLANLLIAIDKADQAVVLAAGKPEAALVLIEACLGPALGHGLLTDGVDLGDSLGSHRLLTFPSLVPGINPVLSWNFDGFLLGLGTKRGWPVVLRGKGLQDLLQVFLAELPDGQFLHGVESLPQRIPGILGELSGLVRGLGGDHAGT